MYPLQVQCVSQPLQVSHPYTPVVYTSAAPSNMVLVNESPPRPPICNQVFLHGNVQAVPQQLIPQQMVPPKPRFPPGAASSQVCMDLPPSPYVNPPLPGSSFSLGVPSSQPSQSGQESSSSTKVNSHGNQNRGFPLPTTPYGFLDGTPQMTTCSSDTLLDGSKKEFMITRAEKVSLWRTFATVFHHGEKSKLETTDNSLLAVFLGLPAHLRRAIRHQGGIGAFLRDCPWFLVSGDKVELVPCMEKLYTCQDDDAIESAEKDKVTEGENSADVPHTWEDLSLSDIEDGGYLGDYVPSEPETSDDESNQKLQSNSENTRTSIEEKTGEIFMVDTEKKEKFKKEEEKAQQLESERMGPRKFQKEDREELGEVDCNEKENVSKRSHEETRSVACMVESERGKGRVWDVEGKHSEMQQDAVKEEKSPSVTCGVSSDIERLNLDWEGRDDGNESLQSSENKGRKEIQLEESADSYGDKFASGREIFKDIGGLLVDARGDGVVESLKDEGIVFPMEVWDESDDPDRGKREEFFAKVDLGDGQNKKSKSGGVSARTGRALEVDEVEKGRKEVCCEENQLGTGPPTLVSKVCSTKDAATSSSIEKDDKMTQTRDDYSKCHVETDVSGLAVEDKKEPGKDVATQTLDGIGQPELKKIMVDCCVDSGDLKPLQKNVSINTDPVSQKTACVNTDPVDGNMECSDRCKKRLASCKSDLQKATLEQIDTEGRLCQTVSKLKQMERECHLLKEIHESVVTDLIKAKEKPPMEEKSTSAELSFDGDALKNLQKSLSEAKVKLLHGNLKNVELQSKLALQLISQAYEESEIIFSMKKMSISKKASLTTQVMKYQSKLHSYKEAVDEWKKKSEAFLVAGGSMEKLPQFPQIDIEKFTPEVSPRGPLRRPSQPSANDIKLAANFDGHAATASAPPHQTTSGMEPTTKSLLTCDVTQTKLSPLSTFTPNKKSDRPGSVTVFDGSHQQSASMCEVSKVNLSGNVGMVPSVNGNQLAVGNTEETTETGATQGKKSVQFGKPSQTLNPQAGDALSTTIKNVSHTKQDVLLGKRDIHRQKQQGCTKPPSIDGSVSDPKLENLGPYKPSAADIYMYMQQAYASQYEYPMDSYCWFGTPLDLYSGQFPVPLVGEYGSFQQDDYQCHDGEQVDMERDDRPGQKPSVEVGVGASSIPTGGSDEPGVKSQSSPSFCRDGSTPESNEHQDNTPDNLLGNRYQYNLQEIVKPTPDVKHATPITQSAAGEDVHTMKVTSCAGPVPSSESPVQQVATRSDFTHTTTKPTNKPSRQKDTGSSPFIFDLGSLPESEVNLGKGTIKDKMQQLPPNINSLPAARPVAHQPHTLKLTSTLQENDSKETHADKVASPKIQRVSLDKTTICHPNHSNSGKRTAVPFLQANIGLDSFDSQCERMYRKKKLHQQEEKKRSGSRETSTESKDSEGGWTHLAGKKKKYSQQQASHKSQPEPLMKNPTNPAEDELIPNYFSMTHLLRKLSEMFPNESRMSLTNIILKVRANHRGQLDTVPFAVIISEAVSLLTASDSSETKQSPASAKKLEDSPEAKDQPAKSSQKGGLLTKLLKNLRERFPDKERSDLIDGIVRVRNLHGNTLAGMTMAQVLLEVSQYLQNSETGHNSTDKQNGEEKDCCTVCLAPLKTTQIVRELECAHRFHDECIQLWFEKRERTCPVCRSHALLEDDFPRLH